MATLADPPTTSAARAAAQNWAANLQSLRHSQPGLAPALEFPTDVEWVYARDGSLTAMHDERRWWAGCSLPRRAAEFMLRKAELPSTVACFLYPQHAAQLRVALNRMESGQALIALIPQIETLQIILGCENFSSEMDVHRLFIAAGEDWESALDHLLEQYPGLPTPTQFIRPILSDNSPADALVEPAQKIFANHSNRRSARVKQLRETWTREMGGPSISSQTIDGPAHHTTKRVCLVAPTHFRLWDDTGHTLAALISSDAHDNLVFDRFDSNDPASASPLALAEAAARCDAIVTPNTGRADLPGIVPDEMPWVTWVTSPRIPSHERAGKWDSLIVADAKWKQDATAKGWSDERVFIGGWPHLPPETMERIPTAGVFQIPDAPVLAIICNTRPLDPPANVVDYSSHRLLWEAIAKELSNNPFALGKSPEVYLSDRMRRMRIKEDSLDRNLLLEGVVLHAWQQGIARSLLGENVPLRLFGTGWTDLERFHNIASGPLRSRNDFDGASRTSSALIHVWPTSWAHPIDAMGKPVICAHQNRDGFLRDVRLALKGALPLRQSRQCLTISILAQALDRSILVRTQ